MRLPVPHRLPLTVAWTGTTASVSMAVATLALATASVLAENWPLTAAACALAAASHAVVMRLGPRLPPVRPPAVGGAGHPVSRSATTRDVTAYGPPP